MKRPQLPVNKSSNQLAFVPTVPTSFLLLFNEGVPPHFKGHPLLYLHPTPYLTSEETAFISSISFIYLQLLFLLCWPNVLLSPLVIHFSFTVQSHQSPLPWHSPALFSCPPLALFLIKSPVPPLVISRRSFFVLILLDLPIVWLSWLFPLSWNGGFPCSQGCHSLLVFLSTTQAILYKFRCQVLLFWLINIWVLQSLVLGSFLIQPSYSWWFSPLPRLQSSSLWQGHPCIYLQTTSLCPANHSRKTHSKTWRHLQQSGASVECITFPPKPSSSLPSCSGQIRGLWGHQLLSPHSSK